MVPSSQTLLLFSLCKWHKVLLVCGVGDKRWEICIIGRYIHFVSLSLFLKPWLVLNLYVLAYCNAFNLIILMYLFYTVVYPILNGSVSLQFLHSLYVSHLHGMSWKMLKSFPVPQWLSSLSVPVPEIPTIKYPGLSLCWSLLLKCVYLVAYKSSWTFNSFS